MSQRTTQPAVLQRLLSDLARCCRLQDRDEICCHGVTVAQCQALQALAPPPDGAGTPEVRMSALATLLGVSVSTATRTIDPLVAKGLVARCVDPRDRRVCCVSLTAGGRELQRTLAREALEAERAILDEIPESRRETVIESLEELRRAFDRAVERRQSHTLRRGQRMGTRPDLETAGQRQERRRVETDQPGGTNMLVRRSPEEIKDAVRRGYARAVSGGGGCCGGSDPVIDSQRAATALGYDAKDLARIPEGAVASSFGCGNPVALAGLRPGDVVLDIGSGAGIDCLLAAQNVGPEGRVIGLDMTPEMIEKARAHAREAGAKNVEFRLGDAESMPVEDASVDWVLSNCVINLAPDKGKVFREIHRVLKPGGRISVSDIVLDEPLPPEIEGDLQALVGCVAGAVLEEEYLSAVREAGLADVKVVDRADASGGCGCSGAKVSSVRITARKP